MKDRLDRTAWLDFALRDLAENGYQGLRAQPMAKRLGVTRGSFYWHFNDVTAFHQAVIEHWSDRTNGALIAELDQNDDPSKALTRLIARTFRSGPALERAIRAWAATDTNVAAMVDQIDTSRIGYAASLLTASGRDPAQASWRARLLYWAAIGRLMMMDPDDQVLDDAELGALVAMMTR